MLPEGRPGKTARPLRALRGFRALLCFAPFALPAGSALANSKGDQQPLVEIELSVMRIAGDLDLDTVLSPIEVSFSRLPADNAGRSQDPDAMIAKSFEDQYLFEADEPAYGDSSGMAFEAEPFGRRLLESELIYYDRDDDLIGNEFERGGWARWRQETLNWGTVDVDVLVTDFDTDYFGYNRSGTDSVVTFRQSAMPVTDELLMNNTFGHQRTGLSSLLHSGYRYRLPTSPLFGATSELQSERSRLSLTTGKIGFYRGVALPRFEETGGRLTTLSFEHDQTEEINLGGQVAMVDGDEDVRDHTSFLFAGRYAPFDGRQEYTGRMLLDDEANVGLWADSYQELRPDAFVRYGAFYFDPDLAWTDEPIANDQTGLYLRGDYSNFLMNLSGGYDFLETGLGNDGLAESQTHSTFFNSSYRVSRHISVGLNGNAALRDFSGALLDDDQTVWRLNAYTTARLPLGQGRLEVFQGELDSDIRSNNREQKGIWTSFDWRLPEKLRLTNEVRVEWNDDLRGDTRRDEFSANFRYDLMDNLSWGINASVYRTEGDAFNAEDGVGINADARWAFTNNWYLGLSVNFNRATYDIDSAGLVVRDETSGYDAVWLTLGYRKTAGRPFPTFGRSTGRVGNGTIRGQVFFDENQDGIRQPSERAAVGTVVILDGRYETRTDSQGRYTFTPVPTGSHEIQVLTDKLPLPWGLDDERPQRVEIGFRRDSNLVFPLRRLN